MAELKRSIEVPIVVQAIALYLIFEMKSVLSAHLPHITITVGSSVLIAYCFVVFNVETHNFF